MPVDGVKPTTPRSVPGRAKASEAEIEARVTRVVELICAGLSRKQIAAFCARSPNDEKAPGFGVGATQAREYIDRAYEVIKQENSPRRKEAISESVAQHRELYRKAHKESDWRLCLHIRQSLDKVLGLDQHFSIADLVRVLDAEKALAGQNFDNARPGDRGETKPAASEMDAAAAAIESDPKRALRVLAGGSAA